ncbi:hypothetical protein [Frateuria defendens]|uniref:hypothetical protein n=1 Tax=Frateuria defendens TaxID=2219559 RepID=UPI001293F249|nr:hypothetical protein [Frateuria defendens]
MSAIIVETWTDGPNAAGQWRGRWHLSSEGETIRGRFGVTPHWYGLESDAHSAAADMANADRRNLPDRARVLGFHRRPDA